MSEQETVSVELPATVVNFARSLVSEIEGQDNRCTASPYFYVIRDKEVRAVPDGCGDEKRYYWDGDQYTVAEVLEHFPGKDIDQVLHENSDIWAMDVNVVRFTPENHNVFLTEKACRQHLDQNRHHFTDPSDYVRHAFRNPEMEGVVAALRAIAKATAQSGRGGE